MSEYLKPDFCRLSKTVSMDASRAKWIWGKGAVILVSGEFVVLVGRHELRG